MAGHDSPPVSRPSTRRSIRPSESTWIWAAPAALSLVFSLSCIGKAALWRDEMATRQFSLLPLGSLFEATSQVDRVLTPYYVFIHFWAYLGEGAVALRLSSTIAATITVAVCARLAQRTWGSAAGLVTGLTFAVNGVFIGTSIEARPYALVALFIAVATLMLTRMREPRVSRSTWWTYGLALGAATLMHVFAVLILLPHVLLFLRREHRHRLFGWLVAAFPAVVMAGLIVLVSRSQSAQVYWSGGRPGPHDVIRLLIAESGESVKAVVLVLAVLFTAALQFRRRVVDDVWLMAVGMLVLPTAALFLVSQVSTPVLVARYVISVHIAAALLLAAAVAELNRLLAGHLRKGAAVGTVVGLVLIAGVSAPGLRKTLTSTFRGDDYQTGDDYQSLAAALSLQAKPGDELIIRKIYAAGGFADGVAYYLGDSAFLASLSSSLVNGEPAVYTRKVTDNDPFRTVDHTGSRASADVWVVELTLVGDATADPLAAQGCRRQQAPNGDPSQEFGDISLTRFRCPNTSP